MIKWIIFFILCAILHSCRKEADVKGIPSYSMTFAKDALPYVQLPLHRYFVYRDSASQVLDSVIVTRSDLYMNEVDTGGYRYSFQVYKLELSVFNGRSRWFYGEANANEWGPTFVTDSSLFLNFCGTDNLAVGLPSNGPYFCHYGFAFPVSPNYIIPSLSVAGKLYTNVVWFSATNGQDQDASQSWYYRSTYYWAKDVGIIKRVVTTRTGTSSLSLERFVN